MKRNVQLLIIDPQNDFCDLPSSWRPKDPVNGSEIAPSLAVSGAHGDMCRLAELVQAGAHGLSEITVTLDSHHRVDIAHPPFWCTGEGATVAPFTQITAGQVRAGLYRPRDPQALPRALAYLDELETRGRYTLMVWPVHCEIGGFGHNLHTAVKHACNTWEERLLRTVHYVNKGSNPWTEHYSALMAEVPDADDADTQLNHDLLARLDRADLLLIAGEASSHCVRATTEHLADHLPSGHLERLYLLTDCMSPVGGFEAQADAFLEAMKARGLNLIDSAAAAALLRENS